MNKTMWHGLLGMCVLVILATPSFGLNLDSLLPDERNTVTIFQKISPQVVYVHRLSAKAKTKVDVQHPEGAGSGMLWDDKGHVVTNYHVVKGAARLAVTMGKLTLPVRVIGTEPRKDIALLQVVSDKATEYLKTIKPFEIAHLSDLIVGQKAIAIGNPFGLDHSLTTGVVSALGREVPGIGGVSIHNMVQTDTPINPGNSGGPLLNSAGQLIGMNTMIYSSSGDSSGIGFAVPADDVARIVKQLIDKGRVVLSGLGIHPVPPAVAARLGVKKGILIDSVLAHTPAAQSGLRGTHKNAQGHIIVGDVIVALNGHPVPNYDALYNLLCDIAIGDRVTVTIERAKTQREVPMRTIDVEALSKN